MRANDNRAGQGKRLLATAISALVLAAVPVFALLFLGAGLATPAQMGSEPAGTTNVLSADFLTLDGPVTAPKSSSQGREPATDNAPGEIRLHNWEFTRQASRFN
ncbi:MAG TPA: hypothetical protein VKA46_40770 [Gemmataceae bacterium]|nr:hypothetical protein [Gemmataceae bacterium]